MNGGANTEDRPPDIPELVELNALLATPGVRRWDASPGSTGVIVVSPECDLAAVWGNVVPAALLAATALLARGAPLLAYAANIEEVRAILPLWDCSRARQHRLEDARTLAAIETGEVGAIDSTQLHAAELPERLREELVVAMSRGPVMAAWADGRPVAFAHAPWRTERWYDISVDTLPEYRRRGHATRAFAALWRRSRDEGLAPVWGAEERNTASLAMAARLGFVQVGEVFVLTPPDADLGLER